MPSERMADHSSGFNFKRDDDLSEAQSEFIESAQLRDNNPKKFKKEESKDKVKGKADKAKDTATKGKVSKAVEKGKKGGKGVEEEKPEKERLS